MKKMMIVLICIISCLVSSIYGLYENIQDKKYIESIEQTENSIYFYVKEDNVSVKEELTKFEELSDKYDATFIRSDRFFEDNEDRIYKSGVFSKNYFDNLNLRLSHGSMPQSSEQFLATYDTGLQNQSGIIKDLFQDSPLIFGPLDRFYQEKNVTVIGDYTLIVDESKKDAVLEELSSLFHVSKTDLLEANYKKVYVVSGFVIYAFILIIIIMAIFSLMCVFYPISRLKEIGAMKLQGYKSFDIWKQLNKQILMIPLIFYVISIGIQKILIKNSGIQYYMKLSLLQLVIFSICVFFSLVMLIVIWKLSISAMLKKFFNFRISLYFSYTLKFLIFVGLIFTIPQIATESRQLVKTLHARSVYEDQKNYLTLANFIYVDNEFQDSLNGENILRKKLKNLYKELEETAGCQYVDVNDINLSNAELSYTEKWKNVKFGADDHYIIMDANKNYLERLNFNLPLSLSEVFDGDKLTVLVPESPENEKDKLEYFVHDRAKSYIYSYENEPDNVDNIPVNIIYYPRNDKEIFSENFKMIDVNNGFVKNPIIFCINDKFLKAAFLENSAIGNPLRILDTPENREKIQEAIIHNDLQLNSLEFKNVLSSGFAQELFFSQIGMMIWGGNDYISDFSECIIILLYCINNLGFSKETCTCF